MKRGTVSSSVELVRFEIASPSQRSEDVHVVLSPSVRSRASEGLDAVLGDMRHFSGQINAESSRLELYVIVRTDVTSVTLRSLCLWDCDWVVWGNSLIASG